MISRQPGSHNVVDGSSSTDGGNGDRKGLNSEEGLSYSGTSRITLGIPLGQTFPLQRITATPFTMSQLCNVDNTWSSNSNINTNNNNLLSAMNLLGDGAMPLSMLLDTRMGTTSSSSPSTMGKRLLNDSSSRFLIGTKMSPSIGSPPCKKQKTILDTNKDSNNNDKMLDGSNPLLMHRLSSLSGGFPMPKFSGGQSFGRKDSNNSTSFLSSRQRQQQQLQQLIISSTKIGAFPMPPLKVQRRTEHFSPPLHAYRKLWDEECVGDNKGVSHGTTTNSTIVTTNVEFQRELFSRRLQAGTVKVEGKINKIL